MDVSNRFLWIVGTTFLVLPHTNLGLLSDYKICGDSECESLLSRVQAIRDHHSKDCRFLRFRRGEIIFVYHKLTGKRDDLWAGSINKQFGYFPKDSVKEEQVYATTEKVVETQKSDFFCIDDFGYPIDPTHHDTDDDSDHKIQIKELETAEMITHSHDNNPEDLETFADTSEESSSSAERRKEYIGDAAEPYATHNEQGGSPSAPWLDSSVTRWLGLAKQEQPGNLAKGEQNDVKEETKAETLLASSVTDWQDSERQGKSGYTEEKEKIEGKVTDSTVSNIIGWFGFGAEEKTDTEKNEQDERRMYLDLEGSQLQKEEKTEMGTLDWLGGQFSNRIGFSFTSQDPGHETTGGEGREEEKEQLISSSWMNIGIENMLGYRKDNIGVDENTGKVTEKDEAVEKPVGLQNTDTGQSQAPPTDEQKTETSNETHLGDQPKDLSIPSPESISADSNDHVDEPLYTPDKMEINVFDVEADLKVDQKVISPHTNIEKKESPVISSPERQDVNLEDSKKIDEEKSEEIKGDDNQMLNSVGSEGEDNTFTSTSSPSEERHSVTSENHDFVTPSDSNLWPADNFESKSNSLEKPKGKDEDDPLQNTESAEEEVATITNKVYNSVKHTNGSAKHGANHEGNASNEPIDLTHKENLTTRIEESAEETQVNDDTEEISGHGQLLLSSVSFVPPIETNEGNSDELDITDDNPERETHQGKSGQEGETQAMEGSSEELESPYFSSKTTKSDSGENGSTISSSESTLNTNKEDDVSDVENLKEIGNEMHKQSETKSLSFEEDTLTQNGPTSPVNSETEILETEETEESEKVKMNEMMEVRKDRALDTLRRTEEEQEGNEVVEEVEGDKEKTLRKEEKEESLEEKNGELVIKGGKEANEVHKEKQREVEDLKETEKQVEALLEKEKQAQVKDSKTSEGTEKDEEDEGEQLQEVQLNKFQSDISTVLFESNGTETKDKNFGSLFAETTQNEILQTAEQKGEKIEEGVGDEMEKVVEKQQVKQVEGNSLKCSEEHCSQELSEQSKTEREGISYESGASSGEGLALTDDQNHLADRIDSKEKTSSGAVGGNSDCEEDMRKTVGQVVGCEAHNDGEGEFSTNDPVEGEIFIFKQNSHDASSNPPGTTESESRGAFDVFKNAFGFLSQTSTSESKEFTASTQSFNSDSSETSQRQTCVAPEQELDSTTDLHKAQEVHAATPTEFPEPYPPSAENIFHTAPSVTEAPLQAKTKDSLVHMSADEMAILMELFGKAKLQFLDYILTSSEALTEIADDDQSILSDMEKLLHHSTEMLFAGSTKTPDSPQEDKAKTLVALQKLEVLLEKVKETFKIGISDITNHQAEPRVETTAEKGSEHVGDDRGKERKSVDEKTEEKGFKEDEDPLPHSPPGLQQPLEDAMKQTLDFVHWVAAAHTHAVRGILFAVQVVSTLPDDIRPGPDLYGVPWEPVIITGLVGLVTILLFTCRCYNSIKSRMYRRQEQWMAEQVSELLDEKCKVLETLSQRQQEFDDLESSLRDSGVLAQTQKAEHLEVKTKHLEHAKSELEWDLQQLKDQMDQQREHRKEQQKRVEMLEEIMQTFEKEVKDLQSQEEQAQTTLRIYNMNSDRLHRNLETEREENIVQQESNAQLRQQVEGWAERVSDLELEMQRCEIAHSGMLQDVDNKDERIMSLTDRLLQMKAWDSDMEEEEGDEGLKKEATKRSQGTGDDNGRRDLTDTHLQKVQKLIYAAKLNADLKSVDEDKDRVFAKLNDEIKAKEELQESIKGLENEKLSLQSETEHYSDQAQRLQQKLQIMTEMYQENELKLHRMLSVEEKERLQKEEKLCKADKNIAMAMEELNNYRQRADEMEEELEKTRKSYQTQISSHEKKAHNNWLAARAAERELADIRRDNALFRQKLTDTQFKLDALDKDPYALNSLARPLPFRAESSMYSPSPMGRPSSETRALLSPPTLMDGPLRLSPRVSRGPGDPPDGHGEMDRSGGPHSDSGSISPIWERDRRGPPPAPSGLLGPPGYMFSEPGGPMFRRFPPPAPIRGMLPPPGPPFPGSLQPTSLPPGPHPADMAGSSSRDNSLGSGDQENRVSGPGDQMTPPEPDPRMIGPPPAGPSMGPMDVPFQRRAPYGPPPPPDFYPPRGPGGPPIMPMWAPRAPGMMFPPFPPGGHPGGHPRLPASSFSRMPSYPPPTGPPSHDTLPPSFIGPPPPQTSHPPQSQLPQENTPLPEDAI